MQNEKNITKKFNGLTPEENTKVIESYVDAAR